MRTTKYLLMMLLLVLAMSGVAQTRNVINVPDIKVKLGKVLLPVIIENTDEIVGAQFDLSLPSEMSAEMMATLTDRCDGHTVVIRNMGATRYRVMLYSSPVRPILGQQGTVFYIPLTIPQSYEEGSEHLLTISNATLSKASGENVLTDAYAGKLIVSSLPDLAVKTISVDKTTLMPGGKLIVSWQVENIGEQSTGSGWSEQISLVNKSGTFTKLIATTYNESILDSKGVVSRQSEITLPTLIGIDGEALIQVRIVSDSETGESASAKGNNTIQGDDVLTVNKLLFVETNPVKVVEGSISRVAVKVSRSGDWGNEQTFSLKASEDGRINLPSSVTIPVGQASASVYMNIADNQTLDADSVVTITAKGNNYPDVSECFIIEDNEYPDLSVSTSKSVVNEGEAFQLTITTSRASEQPIVVTLMSENSKRFSFPSQVTIPAGEESVTVTIETVDDEVPSLDLSNAFTVSAPKHNKADVIVLLKDNDLPVLELTLTPTTLSESAGVVAVIGTLRRTTNIDSKITVKLTDDADGSLYFGNRTIELAKGVEEVSFNFGPVDNANVDGDRTYTITAAVWLSSCNCGASGESAGYTTAQLQVLDNDGAALGLSSSVSTLKEGGTTTLTISRNTATNSPLTVTLNSDYYEGLTYPQSVTIPAGQKSTTVEVVSAVNDVQGDSHNVVFTVLANGYATGTCFITVTDQTKPDAVVSTIRANRYEIEVGEAISLSVVVANKGIAVLPAHTGVRIGCSGSSVHKTLYTPADLAAGDSVVLVSDYQLPVTNTGTYTLTATVNPEQNVSELNYNNNSLSMASITVIPNFSATVTVDKQVYRQGETVVISGQTSAGGRNADVEVYMVNNGTRQSISVKADGEGHFQTTYQPYDRQSGHFVAGACYPRTGETSGSAEFDVYGLLLSGAYATHDISLGDEATGSFVIKNPGLLSQSGLQIVQLNEPVGCKLTVRAVSSIAAGGEVEVSYTLKANEVTDGSDWLQVPLRITTAEGSSADYTIYYYVRSLKGQLKADQKRIETTITKGVPREYQIQISNVGRGETGTISLSLPTWVRSLTPKQMPSLASGESITIVLQLTTTEDMQMNVPVNGQIGINCEKGNGVPISLFMTPVSEDKGQLLIDVVDEYTYYAEGSPHVKDARVLVKHPTTGQVMAQGLTGANGRYQVELPEGWYTVSINADKHQGYETTLEIAPGKQTGKEIFLTYEAVSYSWEVVETEVEDEYEIETVVKYETNVPKPVIIITLPDEKPEIGAIVPVVVTNKGLINAIHADLSLSVSEGLTLEWLTDPTLAVLAPQQSVTFYAVLKEEAEAHSAPRKASGIIQTLVCLALKAKLETAYICGDVEKAMAIEASKAWGNCLAGGSSESWGGGSGGGGIGGGGWTGGGGGTGGSHPGSSPGGSGNSSYNGSSSSGNVPHTDNLCHEKDLEEELTLPPLYKNDDWWYSNDCDIDIKGHHLISSVDGREVKGVAADGAATVYIRLAGAIPYTLADYKYDYPSDEEALASSMDFCGNIPIWSLEENIGNLDHTDGWQSVSYTAPEDFPGGPNESSVTINVLLKYKKPNEDILITDTIPIVITRVPLALIHGLGSDESCWGKFAKNVMGDDMGSDGMYMDKCQVLCVDYSKTHFKKFEVNENVVQKAIEKLQKRCLSKGIVASKADLIGHSMGGILSRLHVQRVNNTNVHKLITVNTPHSGSPWGNVVSNLSPYGATKILLDIFYTGSMWKGGNDGAILDLAIGSEATDNYLNDNYKENSEYLNRMNDIPVHSVTSALTKSPDYEVFDMILAELASGELKDVYKIYRLLTGHIDLDDFSIKDLYDAGNDVFDGLSSVFSIADHWKYGDELATALSFSDCVVPVESQKGGLTGKHTQLFDGGILESNHLSVTNRKDVWEHLKMLLNKSVNDNVYFAKDGFHPQKLEFTAKRSLRKIQASSAHNASGDMRLGVQLNDLNDTLYIEVSNYVEDDRKPLVIVKFPDSDRILSGKSLAVPISSTHYGDIRVYAFVEGDENEMLCDSATVNIATPRTSPISVECLQFCQLNVGEAKQVFLLCTWADNSITHVIPDDVAFTDRMAYYENGHITGLHSGSGTATFTYKGLTCEVPFTVYNFGMNDDEEGSESVCSNITLKLSQTMTMTRQAFRGTLTMFNGNEAMSMKDVKLVLKVTNLATGEVATAHEFQINPESIEGFAGEVDLSSGWTLAGNATGKATVLFIPTKYAAPTEPVEWSFGGTLSYLDPFTGLEVTRDLYPVTLTVKPSPELDLDYFLQRDVFGDDPLTEEVEPMQPAEFALLINNKGYGDATNVRMVTQQPQIIDNEKGLLIDFELLSSQVNGSDKTLAFGQSIANDFGTIDAQSQAYAQWWLQSSLLGHFTEYSVKANHVTSYGNEDLSLLDQVNIHELIHGFTPTSGGRGFLVNDIVDAEDMPDGIYFTDATQENVSIANDATITQQGDDYLLTVTSKQRGWNYGSLLDPTYGRQKIISIIRQSDGHIIPVDNMWQTDRTLRDGKDPLYENRLHFVTDLSQDSEIYLLIFEPLPMVELEVESITGIPDENVVLTTPIKEVSIRFNKDIDANTFTSEDIFVTCQGKHVSVDGITIEKIDNRTFKLDFSSILLADGYYTLTIQTSAIKDLEGFEGTKDKLVSWIQYVGNHIVMDNLTLSAGETKMLSVGLENEISHYNGFQFSLYLPKGVSLVMDNEDNYPNGFDMDITLQGDHYKITGHLPNSTTNVYNPILSLLLHASDQIDTGEKLVEIKDVTFNVIDEKGGFTQQAVSGSTNLCELQINAYISSLGYATFSWPRTLDFEGLGVEAFICTRQDGNVLHLEPISKLPAYTGAILKGTEGYYHPTTTDDTIDYESLNLLIGTAEGVYTVEGNNVFVLSNKQEGHVGFYRAAQGLEIKQYRAFIKSDNNAKALYFDIADRIWNVETQNMDNSIYDIMGRKMNVSSSLHKGVYIINGKKMVIK